MPEFYIIITQGESLIELEYYTYNAVLSLIANLRRNPTPYKTIIHVRSRINPLYQIDMVLNA